MEEVKLEVKDNSLVIEGEFDIELDLNTMHFGCPPEDEELFNRTAFEIKTYGEINLRYLTDVVKFINMKSYSKTPSEWPRWKITMERLYKEEVVPEDRSKNSRHQNAMDDLKNMRFL